MADRLAEVMNTDVLRFEVDAPARAALELLLTTGVTTAPVVDGREHPIGVVSMRQLVRAKLGDTLARFVRAPAIIATEGTSLLDGARLLDEANVHHLVVVDAHGRLAGFVSSLDLVRGIIGAPARHPDAFVHWDASAGAAFSNDRELDPEHVGSAPHAPGLVVVTRGGAGRPERVTWVETTIDIKRWLLDYFTAPDALVGRIG